MSDALSKEEYAALYNTICDRLEFTQEERTRLPQSPADVDNLLSFCVLFDRLNLEDTPSDLKTEWPSISRVLEDCIESAPAHIRDMYSGKAETYYAMIMSGKTELGVFILEQMLGGTDFANT